MAAGNLALVLHAHLPYVRSGDPGSLEEDEGPSVDVPARRSASLTASLVAATLPLFTAESKDVAISTALPGG